MNIQQYNSAAWDSEVEKGIEWCIPVSREAIEKARMDEWEIILTPIRSVPRVWFGDMSIVGPRPPIPYEVEEYDIRHRKRLDMKPGITGLWQVSGRNRLTFEEMVQIDLYYIENWSLWLDLKIILLTLPAVLRGDGAR